MTQMDSGELFTGFCRYGYQQNSSLALNRIYTLLPEYNNNTQKAAIPENPNDLNESQCPQYNRKGLLCGDCMEGYGPSLYSFEFTLNCSDCTKMSPLAATAVYLTLELVPVTVFFFLIMTFRVNIMSGPMLGYIFFCQVHIRTVHIFLSIQYSVISHLGKSGRVLYDLVTFLSGIWNFDFFSQQYHSTFLH